MWICCLLLVPIKNKLEKDKCRTISIYVFPECMYVACLSMPCVHPRVYLQKPTEDMRYPALAFSALYAFEAGSLTGPGVRLSGSKSQ